METIKIASRVEDHYTKLNLFEEIVDKLRELGVNITSLTRSDLSPVDELHVGGAEASKALTFGLQIQNSVVLDVGCGLGGPSRMLAEEFNCRVTGIDLTPEFIRTARKLSDLLGLQEKTEYLVADALDLPFENHYFDIAWTQHVQMNIRDKARFYSEISRVLGDGGLFIYYDIFRKSETDPDYPLPWADDPSYSFLTTTEFVDETLTGLGFKKLQTTGLTHKGIEFFNNIMALIRQNGMPVLGLNLMLGEKTGLKMSNVLNGLIDNRLELQSGIYRKS
jgi:ubiquinone/menaquinone biosynthesis C-methylase UbiE